MFDIQSFLSSLARPQNMTPIPSGGMSLSTPMPVVHESMVGKAVPTPTPAPNSAPTGPSPVNDPMAALRAAASGSTKKLDLSSVLDGIIGGMDKPKRANAGFLDNMSDTERFFFDLGLNMMAEGGKPGASLLGSAGAGAVAAAGGAQKRKTDEQEQLDREEDRRIKKLGTAADLAKMGYDVSYRSDQDAINNEQRDRALNLDAERFNLQKNQYDRPDFQIVQDVDGGYMLVDKNGREASRAAVDAEGNPVMGETQNPLDKLRLNAVGDYISENAGMPEDAVNNDIANINKHFDNLAGRGARAAQRGKKSAAPTDDGEARLNAFIESAKASGYTQEQIDSYLKGLSQKK